MIRLPELLFVYYYTTTSPSLSWLFTKFTSPSWFRGVWSWSFGFVVDIFWSTCCRWVCLCSYFMDRLQAIRWLWTKVIPDQQLYFDDYSERWWHSTMPILADYWRWWLYLDFCWWHSSSTADVSDDVLMILFRRSYQRPEVVDVLIWLFVYKSSFLLMYISFADRGQL